jgi:hypothetical protein
LISIDNEQTIELSRGDSATINLTIPLDDDNNYEFEVGDIIKLRVYEKNGYTKAPVLEKDFEVDEATEQVNIELNEEDTLFAPESNKALTYWYDISLNETQTIVGYSSENGPKLFIITPAKGGNE